MKRISMMLVPLLALRPKHRTDQKSESNGRSRDQRQTPATESAYDILMVRSRLLASVIA